MPMKRGMRNAFSRLTKIIPHRRPPTTIHTLSEEIIEQIFLNLKPIHLISCALVCRRFYRISSPCFFRQLDFSKNVFNNFKQAHQNMSKLNYTSIHHLAIVPHYTTIFSSDQYHLLEQLQCEEFIFRNLCSLKLNIAARESFPSFKSHITNVFCMALCGSSIEEIDISNVNLDELEGLLRERIPDNMAPSFKIPSSSRLKRLKLKDTFIDERHISSKSLFSRFCFQRLRSLKITWKVDNPLTFPVWTQLIASCPALQELKFTNLNFDRPTFNSAVESHLSISTSLPKLSNLISLKLSYPTYGISNLKIYAEYYRILQSSLPKLSLLNLKGVGKPFYPCFQCFVPNLREFCLHNLFRENNNPEFLKCLIEDGTQLKTLVCKGVCDEKNEEFKLFLRNLGKNSLEHLVFETNDLIGLIVSDILIEKSRNSTCKIKQIDLVKGRENCLSMLRSDLLTRLVSRKKNVDWPIIRFMKVYYQSDAYMEITKYLKKNPNMKKIIRYTACL